MIKSITNIQKEVHELAKEKGWWDKPRSSLEVHALIHSEMSEATEAVREDNSTKEMFELADVIIRILDYAEYKGWDMQNVIEMKHEYNKNRPYRHGKEC